MSARRHWPPLGQQVKIHNDDGTSSFGTIDSHRRAGVRVRLDNGRYRIAAWWQISRLAGPGQQP